MANEIKIIIGGDAGDLVRAAKESEGAINRLGNVAQQAERSFAQIGPSMDRAAQSAHRLKEGFKDPSGANLFTGLSQGAKSILRPIEELEAELQDLQAAMRRTTDPRLLKAYGDQIERIKLQIGNIRVVGFQNSLEKINQSATQAAAGLRRIQPGANEATFALTNLSRVVQDAPFGFIGIANNINPLLESFQRLKATSGTTQSAFRALIGSLAGAGGLGLAVGIGSAALSLLGQSFQSGGNSAKKAKEDVSEFQKTLQEAVGEIARDASRATTLFNALNSGTLNLEQRKAALKELQSINKEFFGSLKEEKGLINGLEAAYQSYLDKILQIGRAKAIESQLTKLFDKKLQLELRIDPKFLGATDPSTQRVIGRLRKELEALGGALSTEELKKDVNFFDQGNDSLKRRIAIQQQIEKLEQGIQVINDAGLRATQSEIRLLDLQIAGLSKLQADTKEFGITTNDNNKKDEDSLKRRIEALKTLRSEIGLTLEQQIELAQLEIQIATRDSDKLNFKPEELRARIQGIIDNAFSNEIVTSRLKVRVKGELDLSPVQRDIQTDTFDVAKALGLDKINQEEFDKQLERIRKMAGNSAEMKKAGVTLGEQFADSIIGGLTDGVSLIGETFGTIFSGGGIGQALAGAAQGFLSIIGTVLQEIGKQMIATSVAVQALKKALAALFTNPVAALGAGLGLVALGGILKNLKFNLPKFQDGGITSGPSSGFPAILHPNEAIIPLNKLPDIVGRLKANDLNLTLLPSIRFSGSDFQIMLERVQNRRERLG